MAVRPVISIDVDSSKFENFYKLFESYEAQLEEMPEKWRSLGEAMGESSDTLKGGALDAKEALAVAAAQAGVIAEALVQATKAQSGLAKATNTSGKAMQGLAKAASGVGDAISFVGGWILKLGAFAGLGGILSGFGIGELASTAFTRFQSASRLGLTPGQYASWQVNMQQFLGTDALQTALQHRLDITQAGGLAALGINYGAAQAMSTPALAYQELQNAVKIYGQLAKTGRTGIAMQMPGLAYYAAQHGGLGDVINAYMNPAALAAAHQRYIGEIREYQIQQQQAQAWTDLKVKFDAAGFSIQAALINGLTPLVPQINKLAGALATTITGFLGSKGFKELIALATTELQQLDVFLGSKKFTSDVQQFESGIHALAQALGPIMKALGITAKFYGVVTRPIYWLDNLQHQFWATSWADAPAAVRNIERDFGNIRGVAGNWVNNPLDIRLRAGENSSFATIAQGIQKGTARLLEFAHVWGLPDTLAGIIPLWTGHGIHGTNPAYVAGVERMSGVSRNADLSKLNAGQLASVVAAISHFEGTHEVTPRQVLSALSPAFRGSGVQNPIISAVDAALDKYGASWIQHLPRDVARIVASAHLTAEQRSPSFAHFTADRAAINQTLKAFLKRRPQKPTVHVHVGRAVSARVEYSINAIRAVS